MIEETILGFAVIVVTGGASFFIRKRSLLWFHLVAVTLYFPLMPIMKYTLGYRWFEASDATYLKTYLAIILYVFGYVFVACTRLGNRFIIIRPWTTLIVTDHIRRVALYSYIVVWTIRLIKGTGFGIIYSGSASETTVETLPYWLSIAGSVIEIMAGGTFIVYAIQAAVFRKFAFALIPLIEAIWIFISSGRRDFLLASAVLLLIALYISKIRILTLSFATLIIIVFLWFVSPYFLVARDVNITLLSRGVDPIKALTQSFSIASDVCSNSLDCGHPVSENIIERGNVFEFQKSIVTELEGGAEHLWGEGLFLALRWAIPSAIVPKPPYMTEQFVQNRLSMQNRDDAISIIALSYADLGMLGVLLAGAASAAYFGVMLIILRRFASPFIGVSILFSTLALMWNVEVDPLTFLTTARNIILILIVSWTWKQFRALRSSRFKRQSLIRQ